MRYEVHSYKPSSVAIASLLVLCEDLGFINFQNGILELIQEQQLPVNGFEILQCRNVIDSIIHEQVNSYQMSSPDKLYQENKISKVQDSPCDESETCTTATSCTSSYTYHNLSPYPSGSCTPTASLFDYVDV